MRIHFFAFVLAASALIACNKDNVNKSNTDHEPDPSTLEVPKPVDIAGARTVYNERCSVCHGVNGDGMGPASAALNPRPRNYHDAVWQASVTDEQIKKTIMYGGASVGKSPLMPSNPDLDGKPEIIDGLVQIVRTFGVSR